MSRQSLSITPELNDYLVARGTPPDEIQRDLIAETSKLTMANMQIAPEQGAFMTILTKLIGAQRAIEIGTFTGYSSLAIARGLPDDGELICCDINDEWTSVARRYWERAGVADKVSLRLGPALETLAALPAEPAFDLAFIDAEKTEYPGYWAELLPRMRAGGVLLVDNVLAAGRVVTDDDSAMVQAIRDFNDLVAADNRVETVLLPIADGLTMARKH